MVDKKPYSLDEHLALQAATTQAFLATVEAESNDLVKVTPWNAEQGCLCTFAFTVPKTEIKELTPTGDIHACCGKRLSVVEVAFNEGYTNVAAVVSQQLKNKVAVTHGGGSSERASNCEIACSICQRFPWKRGPCAVCDSCTGDSAQAHAVRPALGNPVRPFDRCMDRPGYNICLEECKLSSDPRECAHFCYQYFCRG
jgi:hypothetical protein